MQTMTTGVSETPRYAPGMGLGNFDRRLYSTRAFVVKVVDVTPDLAKEFLERVGVIHNQSRTRIEQYAATMANDGWKLTHQGIAFNWNGKLADGYLRLEAVVKSGKTVQMAVAFGLDPDDFPAIDTGYARRSKHLMRIAGVDSNMATPHAQGITLLVRYMAALETNKLPPSSRFSPQNILAFHLQHPEFLGIAEEVMGPKQTWREVMPPSVATCLAYMAIKKRHPQDVVLAFLKGIGNFAGQDERHPILVLYKSLHKDKLAGGRAKPEEALAKSIRAYNKWIRKGKMSHVAGLGAQLRKETGEADDEESFDDKAAFPQIVTYYPQHHRDINSVN